MLRRTGGWSRLCRRVLRRWINKACAATAAPRSSGSGRPVNEAFETAVMSRLVFNVLAVVDGRETAVQLANVAHSYSVIQVAAQETAKEEPWCSDAKVRKLKFSDKWVVGFLARRRLVRRKITASEKVRPAVEDVRARLAAIQKVRLV